MSKHQKLAIFIAPVLILLGYIASDYYLESKADEQKLFQLVEDGSCDIINGTCVLRSGDFKLNIFDKSGFTTVNSTFPLDGVTLFLVDSANKATVFPLVRIESDYYWHQKTPLRDNLSVNSQQKLRIIANVKGGQYITEFYSPSTNQTKLGITKAN